jgi:hypothetical protein
MTTTAWIPVHRSSDDELVGYLTLDERGATPLTLFGYPLSGPLEHADAEELLRSRGLAVLAEPWWLEEDGGGFRVQILSARPDAVTVARADYGFVSHDSERRELSVPAHGLRPYAG